VRFWDSSAIVPLLVAEPTTEAAQREHRDDPELMVWWASVVECASAIARLEREGRLAATEVGISLDRLDALAREWREVQPTEPVRRVATRLLRTHLIRAADALHLAAARVASEDDPTRLDIVTLDDRLADAARREGFRVVTPVG
jgi:uncharacterized protein